MASLGYKRTDADLERKDEDLKLRVIPTSVHGTLDYLASGANLAFPTLLELDDAPAAALIPRLDGSSALADYPRMLRPLYEECWSQWCQSGVNKSRLRS